MLMTFRELALRRSELNLSFFFLKLKGHLIICIWKKKEKVTLKSYGASKYATPSFLVQASKLIKKK